MSDLAVVFLGVIALSSLVQAAFMIGLAVQSKRMGRRLEEIEKRFETEIRPSLQNLARLSGSIADVGDIVVTQVRRVDAFMGDTLSKLEEATSLLREVLVRPLGPISDLTAILKGFRKGFEIYRRLGGIDSERKGGARRYADDEHLFI
jgi:hypothetical protein